MVYSGLRRESNIQPQPLFVNAETPLGGSPGVERLEVNSSSPTTLSSLGIDAASSTAGVLAFDSAAYSTVKSLCATGMTTFFSVLASQAGTLQVATDGQSWVSGTWGTAVGVSPGWQEVMIQNGTSCTVTLPGGQALPAPWSPSPFLTSVPAEGALTGTAFTFYIPVAGGSHSLLVTTSGGFDDVAL